MIGNLVASLIAAEAIVTTEAKAKALRPVVEKCVTKAKKASLDEDRAVHLQRQVVALIRDKDMATSCSPRSGRATPIAPGGTPAFSSSAPATATTRPWRASSSYKTSRRGATR
jgi:large subunit ribosomal protein L17